MREDVVPFVTSGAFFSFVLLLIGGYGLYRNDGTRAKLQVLMFNKLTVIKSPFESLITELIGSLRLGDIFVFVQLIFGPPWPMNLLKKPKHCLT